MVGRDYFQTADIKILAGRSFQSQDEETRSAAVIVSRQAVREFWEGENLVASKKHPAIYFPLRLADYAQPSLRGMTLMVRAANGVDAIGAVRREISAMDPGITPFNARSMIEHISQYMS